MVSNNYVMENWKYRTNVVKKGWEKTAPNLVLNMDLFLLACTFKARCYSYSTSFHFFFISSMVKHFCRYYRNRRSWSIKLSYWYNVITFFLICWMITWLGNSVYYFLGKKKKKAKNPKNPNNPKTLGEQKQVMVLHLED